MCVTTNSQVYGLQNLIMMYVGVCTISANLKNMLKPIRTNDVEKIIIEKF
jgi:hypothetical protein